jgi:hypothetical protein
MCIKARSLDCHKLLEWCGDIADEPLLNLSKWPTRRTKSLFYNKFITVFYIISSTVVLIIRRSNWIKYSIWYRHTL